MSGVSATLTAKRDAVATAAVDDARAALIEEVPAGDVGEHLGAEAEADRVITHLFACERAGYTGWRWAVTVARASRAKHVTVDEVVLIPGEESIVAPAWVPYKERVQPGDLSPGDLLPVEEDDPRLVPTYLFGDDPLSADDKAQVRAVAAELGLGRVRTLSVEGRDQVAERWYDGEGGPESPLAKAAAQRCTTCGFLVRLAGPLSETFGVCANGNANDDGRVVSLDHGCGAHSEVTLTKRQQTPALPEHVHDTLNDFETF